MSQLTAPTAQQLLSDVRTQLGQQREENSFWKNSELLGYMNEAIRIYFLECVLANEGHFTTQTGGSVPDLNIVANVETVALPTDCFQVKNVWKKVTGGWVLLPYRNNVTSGYSTQGGTAGESYLPWYDFQGNSLALRPTPNGSETGGIRVEYIAFPDQMIWGGDSLTTQVSPLFKQLIVMYAVYKAKLRESMVNGVNLFAVPKSNLDELYNLFKSTVARRSRNPSSVIPWDPETDGV